MRLLTSILVNLGGKIRWKPEKKSRKSESPATFPEMFTRTGVGDGHPSVNSSDAKLHGFLVLICLTMSQIDKISTFRPSDGIEFYAYEGEIWYRMADGSTSRLRESDSGLLSMLFDVIERFFPEAYAALGEEYKACRPNMSYFRYRAVSRFIKCNFSVLDNAPDFSGGVFRNFEYISCPMRGECRHECVICRPKFNHMLSPAEMRVMTLWYDGQTEDDIAAGLCLSPHTVHNHIRNAYTRLGVSSKAQFIRYANDHSLFK